MLVFLVPLLTGCGGENGKDKNSNEEVIYYCPMHPEVTSDKPGVCPICHMDLVKKNSDEKMDDSVDGSINLNNNKIILANISTVKVVKENLKNVISSYSYLDFAEQNKKLITARFNGRIEKLFIDNTGDYVKKGSPLFEIYSPDLVQAQNDYLIGFNQKQNMKLISYSQNKDDDPLLKSARKKLELFGITGNQIDELEKTGEVKMTMTYFSPIDGTVIEKKVQEGMYVNEGSVIYDISDLSTLWNISEVFENDLGQIKEGSKVQLSLQSYPGETFEGRVSLIYPVVNPQTRTVKVRSIVQNKGNKLKPNMFGETKFEINLGESLVVPVEAVLFTGERKLVYVKVDKNSFSAREIETGFKSDNKFQILSGLNEGDEIAATGAYLIDSESQLRSGATSTHQHDINETKKKEVDHSQHSSIQMEMENNIVHKKDVKVSTLDKNKDGFVYQCPMDWEVISEVPGTCPICKMDLEKFSVSEAQKNLIEYP
ncbi:MAG TPA: efflux RND transporter periplasmic adaptor subunit [Ignavibacteriaceae bacterium]|nr:efflux RND transporter periplasmic adaptor subunit [Ignavibacteriaceae bacterium]